MQPKLNLDRAIRNDLKKPYLIKTSHNRKERRENSCSWPDSCGSKAKTVVMI